MADTGAWLNIKVFRFGDAPHQTRIEGRDIVDVLEKGEEFLSNVRRKYE
jgi:hypothetical protein